MKKWKICLALILVFMFSMIGMAFADSGSVGNVRVFDMADLFTETEEAELVEMIAALQDKMDMDAAVVTVEENPGSARDYADDFYEQMGLGVGSDHDGALFLIDMENGELWISTEGKMSRYLTDARIETMLDNCISYAMDGDFYSTAVCFLEDLEICYENGIAKDQYNYDTETGKVSRYHSIQWYELIAAFFVAAVCGGVAVFSVVREYNMKDRSTKMAANFNLSYRKDSSFTPENFLAGVLLGSYVTKQVIASQNHHSSGGRGGRSLSRGGRSSTHRSSSGRSHGGGGRSFR